MSPFQGESCEFESRFPLHFGCDAGVFCENRELRVIMHAHIAQTVERFLGKDEVTSSNLVVGSIPVLKPV